MGIPDKTVLAKTLRKACVESGFFYLVNHGIDHELMEEVFAQSKRFFDLALEVKMKVLHDAKHRGYTPMAEEIAGDTKEGYLIAWEMSPDDPQSSLPLLGPNQWPSEEMLGGWREILEKYYSEVLKLGHAVTSLLALALDLDAEFFKKMFITPLATLRLVHYAPEHSSPEDEVLSCGAHSDYGLITFLATDSVPGLQICREKDAVPRVWEDVPPMKVAFIVNLGDMLERWTNNQFRSTLHRVVSKGVDRYSIPYFFLPDFDTLVECLPTCCSATNPPKHPPITSGDYMLGRYSQTHTGYNSNAKPVA